MWRAKLKLHVLMKACQGDLTCCVQFVNPSKSWTFCSTWHAVLKTNVYEFLVTSRQRGRGVFPRYPHSEWERTARIFEELSGADVAHSAFHHLASFPATLPPLLALLPSPFISSLSPGPVCLAVGGTCQPHWARALWTPAKAPWGWRKGSSLEKPLCVETELQRFYYCLPQGPEKWLRWPFLGEICLASFSSIVWRFLFFFVSVCTPEVSFHMQANPLCVFTCVCTCRWQCKYPL